MFERSSLGPLRMTQVARWFSRSVSASISFCVSPGDQRRSAGPFKLLSGACYLTAATAIVTLVAIYSQFRPTHSERLSVSVIPALSL